MSSYNQHASPVQVHPPAETAYPPPGTAPAHAAPPPAVQGQAYAEPPPPGYPVNGAAPNCTQQAPLATKKRGEGFWKGCAAALCCCFVFETCCD